MRSLVSINALQSGSYFISAGANEEILVRETMPMERTANQKQMDRDVGKRHGNNKNNKNNNYQTDNIPVLSTEVQAKKLVPKDPQE